MLFKKGLYLYMAGYISTVHYMNNMTIDISVMMTFETYYYVYNGAVLFKRVSL